MASTLLLLMLLLRLLLRCLSACLSSNHAKVTSGKFGKCWKRFRRTYIYIESGRERESQNRESFRRPDSNHVRHAGCYRFKMFPEKNGGGVFYNALVDGNRVTQHSRTRVSDTHCSATGKPLDRRIDRHAARQTQSQAGRQIHR